MSTTTNTTTEWVRHDYCDDIPTERTEFRFEVTGRKVAWLRYNGRRNFAFFDFEKALRLFNSFSEATIWMIKVKEYKRHYSEYSKTWYCQYYVDGSRKMMMRKGLKYMKALQ